MDDPQAFLEGLFVEVHNLTNGGIVWKGPASSTGDFEVSGVEPGPYGITVTGGGGRVLADRIISVNSSLETVEIVLTNPNSHRAAQSTVSLAELRHKVPGKARKEALLAQKAWNKRDNDDCIQHLQKALQIDSDYLAARRDLGLVYLRLNQPENVIAAFEELLRVDPRSAEAYSYISVAYAQLKHFAEGELAARRSLDIDPGNNRSRYMLGLLLAEQKKDDDAALQYLKQSYRAFPAAHVVVAQILARRGEIVDARKQLEEYLPIAPSAELSQLKNWLEKLKQ